MRKVQWHTMAWLCAIWIAQAVAAPQRQQQVPLVLDQTVTVTSRAGDSFQYTFDAVAGETYLVEVGQRGFDFIVTVESPFAGPRSFNSPLFRDERELVLLEPVANGIYEISIYSDEYTGVMGAHTIAVRSLAGIADQSKITGWRLMSQAAEANFAAGRDRWDSAISAYEAAAGIWRDTGEERLHAHALFSVATIEYWQMHDWERAATLAPLAGTIYESIDDPTLAANAIHLQAAALIEQAGEAAPAAAPELFGQAMLLFTLASETHRALGNQYELAQVMNNIGLTHFYLTDFALARHAWLEAINLFRHINEWSGELKSLSNQAVVDGVQGYFASSIETGKRILEIFPGDRMPTELARLTDNLAASYRLNGELDEALRTYSEARMIHARADDLGEAYSVLGIGQTYFSFGDLELATQYLDLAIPMLKAAHDTRLLEVALAYRGSIEYLRGNYEVALEFHESGLRLSHAPVNQARWKILQTRDLLALERYDEASEAGAEARRIAYEAGARLPLADAELELGRMALKRGEPTKAAASLSSARSTYQALGLSRRQADALNLLARSAMGTGDVASALEYAERAVAQIENLRTAVSDPELRAHYFGSSRAHYELNISLLMSAHKRSLAPDQDNLNRAFEVSEKARARMMLDLLSEASIDPERRTRSRHDSRLEPLYEELSALRYQRVQLLNKGAGEDEDLTRKLDSVISRLAETENSINVLETDIRRGNSRLMNLNAPDILSIEDIQEYLEDDTVLLQFFLGDEESFAWVVSSDAITVAMLPARAEIESVTRAVIDGLAAYRPDYQEQALLTQNLKRLSRMIIDPVSGMLTSSRVLVAADGALQYVPFAVLPVGDGSPAPLLESIDVVSIPSVSVLAAQRDQVAPAESSPRLLVLADPVFERSDSRLADSAQLPADDIDQGTAALTRSGFDSSRLARLPFTGKEASAISGLLPAENSVVLSGFEANRDHLLSMDLDQFRYLHFATHGRVDTRYPALSSLALSRFDHRGLPTRGSLRLHDIYALELNAELVVLSACETALGREIRGEGLIGLTQGFMYAGARNLIVSLWQVPDRATAELMALFYEFLLREKLRPAAALRRAQQSIAANRRWRDPYFWGGFVLLGSG